METSVNHHPEHDPLGDLSAAGVAVWLDGLSRELLVGGGLESLVADRHVVGVTNDPTIFASALSKGARYDDQLAALAPVHARTAGLDGCVSAVGLAGGKRGSGSSRANSAVSSPGAPDTPAGRRAWASVR
jgi:hypothetical protein